MKKFFTIIALLILILVSFVVIAVSFNSLSKNEKENERLNTQIQQNAELKDKVAKIEHHIKIYNAKTQELDGRKQYLDIEEADLQKEKKALEKIREELDKESANIEKEEKKLGKEYKWLIGVDASLDKAEIQLAKDELELDKQNSNVPDENGQIPDPQAQGKSEGNPLAKKTEDAKQKKLQALKDRRSILNKAKTNHRNAWKTYQKDVNDLENSKQKHEIKGNSYNIRQTRYETDCLAFNQKNDDFTRDQTEHDRRSVEIQKLREKKAEIEQKISAFEKENPNIQAKYDKFQKTKSYLTMIVATFSFLLLVLIILLVFVIVFKGGDRSQRPKNKVAEKTETKLDTHDFSKSSTYKSEKTIENNEVKENSQNIFVDDTNHINPNLEKRVKQLESDNIDLKKRLEQLEKEIINLNNENKLFSENIKKIVSSLKELNKKVDKQTIAQPRKSKDHEHEENESLDKNSPPQDALIDEYSDSMAREEYSDKNKVYLNMNGKYTEGKMQDSEGNSSSILLKNANIESGLFVLIGNQLYFNFYHYNELEKLPDQGSNGEVIQEKIFNFRKDKYGRIKWCSPAIVELKNGNYVVEDKGSVWIEK